MEYYFYELSTKVLNEKASQEEQKELQNWLDQHPEQQQQFQELKLLWELTTPAAEKKVDKVAAWKNITKRLPVQRRKSRLISLFPVVMKAAAGVALLAAFSWLISTQLTPGFGINEITADTEAIEFLLPDSSKVWLNKGSRILYDPEFDEKERQVKLEGEAFFEVTHNPGRPFIVVTSKSHVRVLGTSFNLRAYDEEGTTELAVATGSVAFISSTKSDSVIITPGYEAILVGENGHIAKKATFNKNAWAWKTGIISFSEQPLGEVIQDLEQFYGFRFQLTSLELADCRFTGTFRNSPVEEVIQVLSATLQLQVKKESTDTYILSGQSCKK